MSAEIRCRTADTLLTNRPDMSENAAIAIGKARLCAGMLVTPLEAFEWSKWTVADVTHAYSFATPCGAFGLDAELTLPRTELISPFTPRPLPHGCHRTSRDSPGSSTGSAPASRRWRRCLLNIPRAAGSAMA